MAEKDFKVCFSSVFVSHSENARKCINRLLLAQLVLFDIKLIFLIKARICMNCVVFGSTQAPRKR